MAAADTPLHHGEEIDRLDTAIRILLSILFAFVHGLLDSLIGAVVVFGLLWSLITRQPPNARLRALANRIVSFDYRIGRYLTWNEGSVPFPFSDFPEALEASTWTPDVRETEELGIETADRSARRPRDEDDDDRDLYD